MYVKIGAKQFSARQLGLELGAFVTARELRSALARVVGKRAERMSLQVSGGRVLSEGTAPLSVLDECRGVGLEVVATVRAFGGGCKPSKAAGDGEGGGGGGAEVVFAEVAGGQGGDDADGEEQFGGFDRDSDDGASLAADKATKGERTAGSKRGKKAASKKATPKRAAATADAPVSAQVAAAIASIRSQTASLERELEELGDAPSPELIKTAEAQATDAVGSTLCVIKSLEQQLAEAKAKVGDWVAEYQDPILKPLEKDLADAKEGLRSALAVVTTRWKLTVAPPPEKATSSREAFAELDICADESQLTAGDAPTMLRVVGAVAIRNGEGAVPGWMFEEFMKKRVAAAGPLTDAILKDFDAYEAGVAAERSLPTAASTDARLGRCASGAAIRGQAADGVADGGVSREWIEAAVAAAPATAAAPGSLAYVSHARAAAGAVSIRLYELVSGLLAGDSIAGECIPGMIKGPARMVFKSMLKYLGDVSKCKDLSRATACVTGLADVAAIVELVLACPDIVVVRSKNRFAPGYDSAPIGGYRDYQLLCLVKDGAGHWRYAELQVNLAALVAIKNGSGGGGHGAFNKARLIDAFSERTLRYNGAPSTTVFGLIGSGALMAVDFTNQGLDADQQSALVAALTSGRCRVRSLKCVRAGLPTTRVFFCLVAH